MIKRKFELRHYGTAPDDGAYQRLCRAYAAAHPTMHRSRHFKEGITNGAHWYPLWGRASQILLATLKDAI
jgi:carboxypeptidase D